MVKNRLMTFAFRQKLNLNYQGKSLTELEKKVSKNFLVSIYGQYNLSDSLEFSRFENDLNLELEENCDVPNK